VRDKGEAPSATSGTMPENTRPGNRILHRKRNTGAVTIAYGIVRTIWQNGIERTVWLVADLPK